MKSTETDIQWKKIFSALEKWRKSLGETEPAVQEVAGFEETRKPVFSERPWVILVSTILSLRTKDDVTVRTSRALLEKAPCPEKLLALGIKKTAKLAYPAGFYKTKAENLNKIAAILLEQYKGKVPDDMEKLLELPGVGRKTANLVLTEAYGKPGICVDIHVHRISNRCGWVSTSAPEKTEMRLREILPRRFWIRINYLLVLYGQRLCRPISPHCSKCVIPDYCGKCGVEKSR